MDKTAALALDIDRLMRRIHSQMHPKALAVDTHRVGPFGGMILITIAEMEPVSVQSLTQALARDKSQMSRILQTLEHKGLVLRRQSTEDRRVSFLALTEDGHELVQKFQDVITDVTDHLFAPLSAKEREQFSAALQKILRSKV